MMRFFSYTLGIFFSLAVLTGFGGEAMAYNCDSSCESQCRVNTPFGTNINPLCQAACQTWKHANCHNLTPQSACGSVGAAGYIAASNTMWERSVGKTRRHLNIEEKTILKTMYSVKILNTTMLHFGVQPMDKIGGGAFRMSPGSEAQTYGYNIYIKDRQSVAMSYNVSWIMLLAHELKHVEQYVNRGENLTKFGRDYFEGWCANGFQYKRIPMEREAHGIEDRAKNLAEAFYENGGAGDDNRYALTCISNETDFTINYYTRWKEDGSWTKSEIAPGKWRSHYWKYTFLDQNRSPKLYIKFDYDLRASGSQFKQYWLTKFASPSTDCNQTSKREQFKYTDGRKKIDLFKNY